MDGRIYPLKIGTKLSDSRVLEYMLKANAMTWASIGLKKWDVTLSVITEDLM